MSVQSEINRITSNITAALTAVADKGVEVPEGANSDSLASLVAAIETGGGVGMQGTYKVAATGNTGTITITHNLGVVPNLVMFVLNGSANINRILGGVVNGDNQRVCTCCATGNGSQVSWNLGVADSTTADITSAITSGDNRSKCCRAAGSATTSSIVIGHGGDYYFDRNVTVRYVIAAV